MSYLEHVELSPAQLKVLSDAAPRGLVAAGAGSGKTRLLVAYFVHALLDEKVPFEKLAAVTFTRKAGSELAERIRHELVECGRPDLARSVDGAAIGTIHGLCTRLLSEQALKAGVDPSFTILEPDAGKLIKEEISKQVWSQLAEEAGESELDALASRGDGLRKQMLSLYDRLRGMGQEMPHLHIDPGPGESSAREALAHACRDALTEARRLPKRGPSLQSDLEKIVQCVEWLERTAAGSEERRVGATTAFFPSRKTASAESWLAPVRAALARYRCALAETELRPLLTVSNRLLALFHEEYGAYKEARGVLDFADLELRARDMLGAVPGAPPERPAFVSHVLIDEFQDTNELQCAILDGLGADRLLMVGDERQSIYRFRGADVDVFRRRKEAKDLGQHRLDTNYRSRPEILGFINRLFSQTAFFGSERFELLVPGREPVAGSRGVSGGGAEDGEGSWTTEVLVVERPAAAEGEGSAPPLQEAEAQAVAGRVRRLLDEEGFSQGEVVLLLPSLGNVGLYHQALLAQQVDVYVVRGKGYYSQDEVADVAALLHLLVNPHDDLSLVTVLRSPLVGVSDDCLYLLGRAAHGPRARSLWEVVREGRTIQMDQQDREKLQVFNRRLDALRGRVGRRGLSRLIDDALTVCDYDLCLLAAPEGKRRFANVRKLMRMAADFEALEGPDLAGFVALIGSMGDLGDDEGNAPSLAEGEDVVRVMTVHQAKGLEFPVVLLAGLGSDAWQETPGEFVVGSDGRAAALVKGVTSNYETNDPHWGPAPEILADEQSREEEEDVRLLYVAMTRAKDKLVLVGARPTGNRADSRRIGRIVTALGLEAFPDPGSVVTLDDIDTAVIGVPSVSAEGQERAARDERGAVVACGPSEGPEPLYLLDLPLPGPASRQVSFSALSAFGRCPRRFYLERVLGLGFLPASEAPDGEGEAPGREETLLDDAESYTGRDIGLLVHALLERLDLTAEAPDPGSLREQAVSGAAGAGLCLSSSGIERTVELIAAFWDSPLAGDPEIGSALREAPFFFLQDDVTVHGVMDLLFQGEQGWRIADYKSNSLGSRAPAEVAESYHMQAAVYCLAGLKAGAPAVRLEFLFLEKPREPVVFEYRQEDRQHLENLLDEALAGIKQSSFPAHAGPACSDCGVESFCRAMTRL